MPARIQRKRTKGWKAPAGAIYVGRGTRSGNPWVVVQTNTGTGWAVNWAGDEPEPPRGLRSAIPANDRRDAHALAVELYETWLHAQPDRFFERAQHHLAGRTLMCWCPDSLPCHADVLLRLSNPERTRP